MSYITVLSLAFALAMDAFAVSVASGAAFRDLHIAHTLRIALFFGIFQAIMPLIGYLAGQQIEHIISSYDHWVAFVLLITIGIKMIYEAFKIDKPVKNPAQISILLVLSIATSIDALAVGLTLSILDVSIILDIAIIGVITFVLSLIGVQIGKKIGHLFEGKIEIIGGIILIIIGLKILLQHFLE